MAQASEQGRDVNRLQPIVELHGAAHGLPFTPLSFTAKDGTHEFLRTAPPKGCLSRFIRSRYLARMPPSLNRSLRLVIAIVMLLLGTYLLGRITVLGLPPKTGTKAIDAAFALFFLFRATIALRQLRPKSLPPQSG
jgi:hypothetical protein